MTSSLKTILFLFLLTFAACKSDPSYKTVAVDFFVQHPELSITPATFDTLTEQVIVSFAYLEGATFDTVTEQVLLHDQYRDLKIMDIEFINVLANHEENLFCSAPCITYYPQELVEVLEVQAKYVPRNVIRVDVEGTGAQIPATYSTRDYFRQKTDAVLNLEPAASSPPIRKIFRIPVDMDFDTFWEQTLTEQHLTECGGNFTYNVVEL